MPVHFNRIGTVADMADGFKPERWRGWCHESLISCIGMSSIIWHGQNLIQRAGGNTEELGYVKFDPSSNSYVLWLRDLRGVFGPNNAYIRCEEFSSMEEAKQKAASSTSAFLFHWMWLVYLRDQDLEDKAKIDQEISDRNSSCPINTVELENHEFDVALSFPGSARKDLIEEIVTHLEKQLGPDRYFYDKNYPAQLARPSLDTFLQAIYLKRSKLIVVFIGGDYQSSYWCSIEFSAIREIINNKENNRIMYIRLDEGEVEGIFPLDGYIDCQEYGSEQIAEFIIERLNLL